MQNTPQTRRVTRGRIGPWYVLQSRNPAAPGMKFDVLIGFIRKGQVTARSIVRGPTTHQFWRYAAHVKGLSREFGLCYDCGAEIATESNLCPYCGKLQEPPVNADMLLEGTNAASGRPTNGHPDATVSAVPSSEAAAIPDMVDAEVVRPKTGYGPGERAPKSTHVVIEPLVEPKPPLVELESSSNSSPDAGPDHQYSNDSHNPMSENSDIRDGNEEQDAPVNDVPPAAQTPPADPGALMSPADLAAAFHMKFAPVAQFDHQVPPKTVGHWIRLIVLILVVMAACALVAGAILWPDYRAVVFEKVGDTWDSTVELVRALFHSDDASV
jgi:hypothetical protein